MKKSLYTLQDGIKSTLKDLNDSEVNETTKIFAGVQKNKKHFYKCAEGGSYDIHHKYSVALDIASLKKGKIPSMLKAHEAMIDNYFSDNKNTTTQEINYYVGQVMKEIGSLTNSVVGGLEDGILTQAEKNEIKKAIKSAEESIMKLKSKIGNIT
tara:strand:+ start:24 stop:485 length:462 start_codon:yes stop_codon:yes gene_type:complete